METISIEQLLAFKEANSKSPRDYVLHDNKYYTGFLCNKYIKNMVFPDLGDLSCHFAHNSKFENILFLSTDFYHTDFVNTEFINCIFTNGDFVKSEIYECKFQNSIFDTCRCVRTHITKCTFDSSVISNSNLFVTSFDGTVFNNVIFSNNSIDELKLNELQQQENIIWRSEPEST